AEFEKVVMRYNNILEVHRLTGSSADYLLKIIAKSIEEYDAFQQQLISEIQFTGMSSSISLKEVKNSKQIPV
ncbi:Lrp/AsnC ligand binding domain-containing protein, partial [Paracoccaceae bacterium]|nr:Lrp/AsnC ligand binding domain-containing protein [Paracoccaceae bacterium]